MQGQVLDQCDIALWNAAALYLIKCMHLDSRHELWSRVTVVSNYNSTIKRKDESA